MLTIESPTFQNILLPYFCIFYAGHSTNLIGNISVFPSYQGLSHTLVGLIIQEPQFFMTQKVLDTMILERSYMLHSRHGSFITYFTALEYFNMKQLSAPINLLSDMTLYSSFFQP